MPSISFDPPYIARIITSKGVDPILCRGEWTVDEDARDIRRLRVDSQNFPDFWLACRFNTTTRSLSVEGGRFPLEWNAEFSYRSYRQFQVEVCDMLGRVSCLDTCVEFRLPFPVDAYDHLRIGAIPPPGVMYNGLPMGDDIAKWIEYARRGDMDARRKCCELRDATIQAIDELQADEMIKQRMRLSVPQPYWS